MELRSTSIDEWQTIDDIWNQGKGFSSLHLINSN